MQVSSASYYNALAQGYNTLHGQEQRNKLQAIFSSYIFSFSSPPLILDVGCGTGISSEIIHYLAKQGIHVQEIIGIDPSVELLKQNPFPHVLAYAEALPFPDNSFDLVISLTAAQNFDDLAQGLQEIHRVAKNLVVISLLKKSPKKSLFLSLMHELFTVVVVLEEEKDVIVIGKKRNA